MYSSTVWNFSFFVILITVYMIPDFLGSEFILFIVRPPAACGVLSNKPISSPFDTESCAILDRIPPMMYNTLKEKNTLVMTGICY